MKKGFWALFGTHLYKIHSMFSLVIGIGLSFLLWQINKDMQISMFLFLVLLILCVLIISSLISALFEVMKSSEVLPEVERVLSNNEQLLILLSPSSIFSHGIIVSLYYTDEFQFERLICIGTVLNIQENGKIQIRVHQMIEGQDDVVLKLSQNDCSVLKKITVKPNVSHEYIVNAN